jgi:Fe2+ or Zn2+ uptake regulation protein
MAKPELDECCEKIFAYLALQDEPVRFNELHKLLNKSNFNISRPTLIAHLKHLLKHKVITKNSQGKQNIAYGVNWKTLDYLRYHKNFRKAAERIQENKATFEEFDLDEKITYVSLVLSLIEVTKLKNEIRSFLEPNRKFEATLAYLFVRSYLEPFRMYLLRDCLRSKTIAKEALVKVEELERKIQNEVFDVKPEK